MNEQKGKGMKLGQCDRNYFSEDDEFNAQIPLEALDELLRQYKHCCRLAKTSGALAACSLCPHDLAIAKQYQLRRDHLEVFLRLLCASTKDYDIEAIGEKFGRAPDNWSLILRDRISL